MSINDAIAGFGIELKDLYHPSLPPTKNIADVLHFLQQTHQKKHGDKTKIHFLIDEFNQEILTTTYSPKINETLQKLFMESTIVIALQSVSKNRSIVSVEKQNKLQTEVMDVTSSGMKPFEFKTCIRMTYQLHQLQKVLEEEIQNNDFIAPLTFKGTNFYFTFKLTKSFIFSNNKYIFRHIFTFNN